MGNLHLHGTLPLTWAKKISFHCLENLLIGADNFGTMLLEGTLPTQWGNPLAFRRLKMLGFEALNITGDP